MVEKPEKGKRKVRTVGSGLVDRAAQIFSIPYYYKNSETLSRCMRPLHIDEKLEDGDLLWFGGHVMVVTDIKNNRMLEARGYASGFGMVHEAPLCKLFINCTTYEQLVERYHKHAPLHLTDSNGSLRFVAKTFALFKLKSVWDQECRS